MTRAPAHSLTSIRDLISRSDFARLNPGRTREILDRCADPSGEDRPLPVRKELTDVTAS